jgi:hypothetical protein
MYSIVWECVEREIIHYREVVIRHIEVFKDRNLGGINGDY